MMRPRRWMLGVGMVWLAAACSGNADATEVSTTTIPAMSTTSSSSTTSTTVIDGEAILNGFVTAVTDPDAIGVADMTVTFGAAGVSVSSTGWVRFSGADSHSLMEVAFLETRSEEITIDGEVFVKDGDGPWLAVSASGMDGIDVAEGPGSDTIAFLSTLSSLEYAGRETVEGIELHRLGTPPDFEFDPALLGLDVAAEDISGFEQSFLVDDDGIPVRWDLRFEADTYNVMVGRDALTTLDMEILFHDWGTEQHIAAPDDYWVPYESDQFAYAAALPSKWRVYEELGSEDFAAYDLLLGPLGEEIHVYAYPLEEAAIESFGPWLSEFRSHAADGWGANFDTEPQDVEVAGTWSPLQEFSYPDDRNGRIYGIYVVTQPSLDTMYEFISYSGRGSHDGDADRFREFLATFELGPARSGEDSGGVSIRTLGVGKCFDDLTGAGDVGFVEPRGCHEPHDNEVFAWFVMPHDAWPGENATNAWADQACYEEFAMYTGETYAESPLDYGWWYPIEETWQAGDRTVICALWDFEGNELVGSMRSIPDV